MDKASDPVPKILKDPIGFNWAVKDLILKIIIEKGLIELPSYDDIADIFSLRNDFAHNPIHLKDGELVLTKKIARVPLTKQTLKQFVSNLCGLKRTWRAFKFRRWYQQKN